MEKKNFGIILTRHKQFIGTYHIDQGTKFNIIGINNTFLTIDNFILFKGIFDFIVVLYNEVNADLFNNGEENMYLCAPF
jgi:hypothetical protein